MGKNILLNIFSLGTNYIFPLIIIPLAINAFGMSGYGEISVVMTMTGILLAMVSFNLENISPIFRELDLDDDQLYISFAIIRFVLYLISFFVLLFIVDFIFPEIKNLYLFSSIAIFFQVISSQYLFIKNENYKFIFFVSLVSKIFSGLLSIYSCLILKSEMAFVISINSWVLFQSVISLVFEKRSIHISTFDISNTKKCFLISYKAFFSTILSLVLVYSVQPIVAKFVSFDAAGLYSIYEKIIKAINGIYSSIYNVILSRVVKDKIDDKILLDKSKLCFLILSLITISIGVFIFGWIIEYFFEIKVEFPLLVLSCLTFSFTSFGNYFTAVILTKNKLFTEMNVILIQSSVICLVASVTLSSTLGLFGGLLSILISEIYSCVKKVNLSFRAQ